MRKLLVFILLLAFVGGCTVKTEQSVASGERSFSDYKYRYKVLAVTGRNRGDVVVRENGKVYGFSLYKARIDEDVDQILGSYAYTTKKASAPGARDVWVRKE